MKKMITLIGVCAALTIYAQPPGTGWAKQLQGTSCKALHTDAAGNVYTLGELAATGNFDFDPGPGTFLLNGANGTTFISKLNSNGEFVFARQFSSNEPEGFYIDAAQNVYVTGQYTLTSDFDPGPGVFNMTAVSQNDIYVLKLTATGDFIWARSMGGTQSDIGFGITVSSTGNVYTTGYFMGTADFDPGAGSATMSAGIGGDTFLSALDVNGNFLWARQIPAGNNQGHTITTTAAGTLVVTGTFTGTKDFDPGPSVFNLVSAGAGDVYIWRVTATGDFIGAGSVGGIGTDNDEGIAVDAAGNIYVTGSFSFTPDFDPGPGVFNLTASGSSDIFVLKLDAGGALAWARQLTGASAEAGHDVEVDLSGNVYTTGLFLNTVDFDPGPSVFNLTSVNGNADIFISKLDASGNFAWALAFGATTSEDRGNGIGLDPTGNVYVAGNFQGQIDFDPGPATAIVLSGVTNVFVVKLGTGIVLPLTLLDFSATTSQQTVLLNWQTSQETNTANFEVEWSTDGQSYTKIADIPAAGNSTQPLRYNYTHQQPANTINYYRLKMIDVNGRFTYSAVIIVRLAATLSSIHVFPNPVTDVLQLTIEATQNETLHTRLIDAGGKTIRAKSFTLLNGTNQLSWDLTTIPPGNYFIVSPGNRLQTIKITKR